MLRSCILLVIMVMGFQCLLCPFSNNSSCLEFNVRLDYGFQLDFLEIRKFLQNIEPTNVLASLVLEFCIRTVSLDY